MLLEGKIILVGIPQASKIKGLFLIIAHTPVNLPFAPLLFSVTFMCFHATSL
jgi:hypothetical protein